MGEIASSTARAAALISQRLGIEETHVRNVIQEYTNVILECLDEEIPFSIAGFGKFYFTYVPNHKGFSNEFRDKLFKNKVNRRLRFTVSTDVKPRLQGWVHDLGLKNNIDRKEMMRLAIKPEEIAKTRRQRMLEEQRSYGFRPELLFDEDDMSPADKEASKTMPEAPSVEEMLDRLGANIDLKK